MVHEYSHTTPAVKGILSFATFSERKHMLKNIKRKIALVAVAAVGVGMLSAIPASAVASLIGFNAAGQSTDTGAPIIQRTDTAAPANMVIDVNATGVITASGVISWTLSRNGGTAGTTLPGGMSIAWDNTNTDATAAGANAPAANAASAFAKVGNNADNDLLFALTVAKTAAPGKYVLSVKAPAAGDAVTLTFYVSGAPTAMAWDATSYTVDQNTNNAGATKLAITDVAGNPTYLLAGEAIDVAVTAVSGATLPTTSVTLVDTGNSVLSSTTVATTIAAAAGATAGTYSLVASRSAGLVGLANATTSIVVGASPVVATQIGLKTTTFTNSDAANTVANPQTNVADTVFDGTTGTESDSINSTDTVNDVVFVSTNSPALTFVASTANDLTTGSTRFSVAANGGATLPNGVVAVTAANVAVVDTAGAGNASTSEYTVTSTSPVAGSSYLVKAVSTAATKGFAVTYQNPVPNSITRTTPASSPILTKIAGTSTATATVKDQFGVAIPNVYVTVGITGRNPQSKTILSDAAGLVSMSWTDTYVSSTTNTATADTLTFTIVGSQPDGAPAVTNTATLTINYTASVDVKTLTMTAATNAAGGDLTYEAVATTGTHAVTINPSVTFAAGTGTANMADAIRVKAVATDAAAAVMQGVPVVFTATDGVFFATDSGSTTGTQVAVAGSTAVKTVTVYTNAQGEAFAQARFTKTGTGTVTATTGTTTGTFSVTAATAKGLAHSIEITPTATAAADGAATLTATVKDPFGNVVSGAAVSFVGTGVIFLNGLNAVSGSTDTNGQIVVQALSGNKAAGTATVKATVTETSLVGTLATDALVTTTTLAIPVGVSNVTSTITYTAATAGGASTAIDGVKTDVATANAAVKALATQVTVLQASVATLIDSLTTQIASLMKSVSALTKAVAKLQAKK
jgi:hypothetical protein